VPTPYRSAIHLNTSRSTELTWNY